MEGAIVKDRSSSDPYQFPKVKSPIVGYAGHYKGKVDGKVGKNDRHMTSIGNYDDLDDDDANDSPVTSKETSGRSTPIGSPAWGSPYGSPHSTPKITPRSYVSSSHANEMHGLEDIVSPSKQLLLNSRLETSCLSESLRSSPATSGRFTPLNGPGSGRCSPLTSGKSTPTIGSRPGSSHGYTSFDEKYISESSSNSLRQSQPVSFLEFDSAHRTMSYKSFLDEAPPTPSKLVLGGRNNGFRPPAEKAHSRMNSPGFGLPSSSDYKRPSSSQFRGVGGPPQVVKMPSLGYTGHYCGKTIEPIIGRLNLHTAPLSVIEKHESSQAGSPSVTFLRSMSGEPSRDLEQKMVAKYDSLLEARYAAAKAEALARGQTADKILKDITTKLYLKFTNPATRRARVKITFTTYDKEASGVCTADDIKAVLRQLSIVLPDIEFQVLCSQFDDFTSGLISYLNLIDTICPDLHGKKH